MTSLAAVLGGAEEDLDLFREDDEFGSLAPPRPPAAEEPPVEQAVAAGAPSEAEKSAAEEAQQFWGAQPVEAHAPSAPASGLQLALVPTGRSFRPPSVSARFFIIKSYNHQNIGQSISTGVWATQAHNECKLAQAFGDGDGEVLLVFSVNGSGHFQGYARMETPIGRAKGRWTGDAGALGGTFGIQWECLYDLPFSATSHMCNPLNEGKPIKISRDGTELPADIGVQLVNLFEAGAQQAGLPRPKPRPHVEWEQPRGEPRGGARAPQPQPQPQQQQQQRSPESAPEAEEQGKSRRDRKRGSRSRSRSRDRHRKHSSRKRRSREGDGDAAQREYLEYCAHYMRTQGWDGRGGEEGMTRFWNAFMQGGGGGPPGGGWGAPPQGAWGGHGWGAWGGGGGRGRGWGGGGPGWR